MYYKLNSFSLSTANTDNPINCSRPSVVTTELSSPVATGDVLDGRPGSVVTWQCTDGYHVMGKKKSTCLHTGQWSSEKPTCEQGNIWIDGDKLLG